MMVGDHVAADPGIGGTESASSDGVVHESRRICVCRRTASCAGAWADRTLPASQCIGRAVGSRISS
jgi:hypothetical protein